MKRSAIPAKSVFSFFLWEKSLLKYSKRNFKNKIKKFWTSNWSTFLEESYTSQSLCNVCFLDLRTSSIIVFVLYYFPNGGGKKRKISLRWFPYIVSEFRESPSSEQRSSETETPLFTGKAKKCLTNTSYNV